MEQSQLKTWASLLNIFKKLVERLWNVSSKKSLLISDGHHAASLMESSRYQRGVPLWMLNQGKWENM